MDSKTEQARPEFRKHSLENLGQLLKVSASLPPDYFPYRVGVDRGSPFFRHLRDRLFMGRWGLGGMFIEHTAIIGVNDIGEVMVGQEIFKGDSNKGLTKESEPRFQEYARMLKSIPLSPGWRTIGIAHSHPFDDALNHVLLMPALSVPRVDGIPITWSGTDFGILLEGAKYSHSGFTTSIMLNGTQMSFMAITLETVNKAKASDPLVAEALNSKSDIPPYKIFEKLGIVLYAGNHFGRARGEMILERLK